MCCRKKVCEVCVNNDHLFGNVRLCGGCQYERNTRHSNMCCTMFIIVLVVCVICLPLSIFFGAISVSDVKRTKQEETYYYVSISSIGILAALIVLWIIIGIMYCIYDCCYDVYIFKQHNIKLRKEQKMIEERLEEKKRIEEERKRILLEIPKVTYKLLETRLNHDLAQLIMHKYLKMYYIELDLV